MHIVAQFILGLLTQMLNAHPNISFTSQANQQNYNHFFCWLVECYFEYRLRRWFGSCCFFFSLARFFFFTLNALGQQLWLISWIFYLFFFSSSNWIFVREYFVEVYCLCVSLKFFRDFQWPWCWKPFLLANFVCVCGIFGSIESTQIHLKH